MKIRAFIDFEVSDNVEAVGLAWVLDAIKIPPMPGLVLSSEGVTMFQVEGGKLAVRFDKLQRGGAASSDGHHVLQRFPAIAVGGRPSETRCQVSSDGGLEIWSEFTDAQGGYIERVRLTSAGYAELFRHLVVHPSEKKRGGA